MRVSIHPYFIRFPLLNPRSRRHRPGWNRSGSCKARVYRYALPGFFFFSKLKRRSDLTSFSFPTPFKRDAEKKDNDDNDRRGMLDFCSLHVNVLTSFVRLQIFATSTMRSSLSGSYVRSLNAGYQGTPKRISFALVTQIGFAVAILKCSTSPRSIGISWRVLSLPLVAKGSGHVTLNCAYMVLLRIFTSVSWYIMATYSGDNDVRAFIDQSAALGTISASAFTGSMHHFNNKVRNSFIEYLHYTHAN
jgi:hypothetical protein